MNQPEADNPCVSELAACRADNEELREQQRQRSDFLLSIVHEFRNPLTAMAGALEILRDSLADRLTAKEREFFGIVDVSQARLNQMLDEMLELMALEGREVTLAFEPTDLVALAEEVVAEFQPRARIYRVKINPPAGSKLVRAECDPEKVRRVLANLVSNGIKYNHEGGEVTVTLTSDGAFARVTVSDTGAGIPPEDHDRVFQQFYRNADVRRKGIVGTGLGLTIARNIVEMHGGEIGFTSRPGVGSTFHFTLPVRRSRPAAAAAGDDGR